VFYCGLYSAVHSKTLTLFSYGLTDGILIIKKRVKKMYHS
jgi:hypothetical protein